MFVRTAILDFLRSGICRVVLIGGFISASLVFFFMRHLQESRAENRFWASITDAHNRLERNLSRGEDLVRTLQFLAQNPEWDRSQCYKALENLETARRYPGLRSVAVGYLETPWRKTQKPSAFREQAQPNLHLRFNPILLLEAGPSDIAVLQGMAPGSAKSAWMAWENKRVEAGSLTILPELGPALAFHGAFAYPDLSSQDALPTIGYVAAVFLLEDLAKESIARLSTDEITLQFFDLSEKDATNPILKSPSQSNAQWWHALAPAGLSSQKDLNLAGRMYRIQFSSSRAFFQAYEVFSPWFTGLSIFLLSILLSALIHSINQTGEKAQILALRMTQEFQNSTNRLRAITQLMPDALWIFNSEGRIIEVLTQDLTTFLAPREKVLHQKLHDVIDAPLAESFMETMNLAQITQQVQSMDYRLDVNGDTRYFEAKMALLPMERESCVICVARDVTDRKQQDETLRQSQKLESLGILAGGIAHDFNNLLAAIQGHLSLANLSPGIPDLAVHHLNRMEQSVEKATDLVRKLLAYTGKSQFSVQEIDLNRHILDLADLLDLGSSKKAELHLDLGEGLPRIQADRTQLQQVIHNLATNANEALGEKSGRIDIQTRKVHLDEWCSEFTDQVMMAGDYVELCIQDEGEGMDTDTLERISDPFFSTKGPGRGLGLSVVRGILQSHRAGFQIESEPGKGTQIRIHFPIRNPQSVPPVTKNAHTPEAQEALTLSGLVLLAEDEPVVRETTRIMLERLGFEVLEAMDGEEAWLIYQAHPTLLRMVVLDVTMPKRSGLEVYQLIRQNEPHLPILICSGYSRKSIPEPENPSEPRSFLEKPFTLKAFETTIRELLA